MRKMTNRCELGNIPRNDHERQEGGSGRTHDIERKNLDVVRGEKGGGGIIRQK